MTEVAHTVYFHGKLAKLYGKDPFDISGRDIKEVFRGLRANLGRGFHNTILNGHWQITKGKRKTKSDFVLERDNVINPQEIELQSNGDCELHIFPALMGAGKFGQIILGVVLIIIGALLIWVYGLGGIIAKIGIGLIVTGIATSLAGIVNLFMTPSRTGSYAKAEVGQNPSFLYNGPVNVIEQGGPVPVIYGIHMAGSTVISAALDQYEPPQKGNLVAELDSTFAEGQGNWIGETIDTSNGYLQVISGSAALNVALEVGKEYKLSCIARAGVGSSLRISVKDGSSTYNSITYSTNATQHIEFTFTVPPIFGQTKIEVSKLSGDGSVYFDNFSLVEI